MGEKISVIIPVYNVEPYLDRCIESIVNQTYKNLEILLIDDGSTDKSGEICDRWQERDSRIQVLHKANAGLGMARNSGLEMATGTYIAFVDSDDYVERDLYELMAKRMAETGAAVCYYGLIKHGRNGKAEAGIPPTKTEYTPEEFIPALLDWREPGQNMCFAGVAAWSGMYKSEMIARFPLRFENERIYGGEDRIFNLQYILMAEKIYVEPECKYHYCFNQSSLTKTFSAEGYKKSRALCDRIKAILSSAGLLETNMRYFYDFCLQEARFNLKGACRCAQKTGMEETLCYIQTIIRGSLPILMEKRYTKPDLGKRLLYFFMRHNMYRSVYILTSLRLKREEFA